MLKKIKSKRLKALICLICAAIFCFVVVSVIWLYFYNVKAKPLMKNLDSYECTSYYDSMTRSTYYSFGNEEEKISYDLAVPGFLRFLVDVQVLTGYEVNIDSDTQAVERLTDYAYFFRYTADVFGEGSYSFRVDDYIGTEEEYVDGIYVSSGPMVSYHIEVDRDMNFVSGDKAVYDEHYNELKKLYDKVMKVFGKDAFK